MECPNCHHQNESNAKFCSNCGTKLTKICSACKFENTLSSNFCSQCGNDLRQQTEVRDLVTSKRHLERRQVTAMFCDLVGSTKLSEKLDLEEYSALVAGYQDVCKRIIRRFDGKVHQLLGDGVVTFFGFPKAHEDDARRCVQCALEIVKAIEQTNVGRKQEGKSPFAIRIGIHTGMVVGGEISGERQVLGKTPNLAARLEGIAEVGSIAISPATYKLVKGYFEVESLGFHTLKGISKEMEAFKVIGPSGKTHRLDLAPAKELSPFVGREGEVNYILNQWNKVQTGSGHALLIKGDAGIGKSRLLRQLKEKLSSAPGFNLLEMQTSPLTQNSALYPLTELLKNDLIDAQYILSASQDVADLQALLTSYGMSDAEHLTVLYDLLVISPPESFAKTELSAAKNKQITLEILTKLFISRSSKKPLLVFFEDLHWTDNSTLEWIETLVEELPTSKIFVLFTSRPMAQYPKWISNSAVSQLTLKNLPVQDILSICQFRCGGKKLPSAIISNLVKKTDGIPLFVEEMTSDILESGMLQEKAGRFEIVNGTREMKIPATLQDSLTARLDRLKEGKGLVQIGAVLGRDFSYEILRAVSGFDEAELNRSLTELTKHEFLFRKGTGSQSQYIFKHALIQDAAYDSLVKEQRRNLHQKVAEVIEAGYPNVVLGQPELLANHLTKAGKSEAAIQRWMEAGNKAMQRSANVEAVKYFEEALGLIESLPESTDRVGKEIQVLLTLGALYQSARSFTGPDAARCFEKAYELSQKTGASSDLVYANCGILSHATLSGNFDKAISVSEILLKTAEETGNETYVFLAHTYSGYLYSCIGTFETAEIHLEKALQLYDQESHGFLTMLGIGDLHNLNLTWYAWGLALKGYYDKAIRINQELHARTAVLNHLVTTYVDSANSGCLYGILRDPGKLAEMAEAGYPLAVEKQELFVMSLIGFLYGYSQLLQGDESGLVLAYESMQHQQSIGNRAATTSMKVLMGEYLVDQNKLEEGHQMINEGLELLSHMGGRNIVAEELYRINGKYHEKKGAYDQAESYYLKSIRLARSKQTKLLELRASNNLARLWFSQGKTGEALDLLSNIYNWFTEGFSSSADLMEAKDLLDKIKTNEN